MGFPPEILAEAERVAGERTPLDSSVHEDRTDLALVTIDPPGSRDLDQAVGCERNADGFRLWYAIADVAFWVDRDSAIEREAWLRGVTFYAPDCREPLYPPVLSQDAASLLPNVVRPALLWEFELDARAEVRSWRVARARVRSRAQLTYGDFLRQANGSAGPHASMLRVLSQIGEERRQREEERGGVSLPVRDQHVQQRSAAQLGYQLAFEQPNAAEGWNAQVSLLTGHVAALCMLGAGVGLLRVADPPEPGAVAAFRQAARALGFSWSEGLPYAEFLRGIDPRHPDTDVLVWQARRVTGPASYAAFDGSPPEHPEHGALAFAYAHCTAPLRRLADRYVLDLVAELSAGGRPDPDARRTLFALPDVMHIAQRKASRLERRVVDLAEAWVLRERIGAEFAATVVGVGQGAVEVQIEEPPIRTTLQAPGEPVPGAKLRVRVAEVDLPMGRVRFQVAADPAP